MGIGQLTDRTQIDPDAYRDIYNVKVNAPGNYGAPRHHATGRTIRFLMNAQRTTMKGDQRAIPTRTFALSLSLAMGLTALAWNPPPSGSGALANQRGAAGTAKAAGCAPASQLTQLAFNNVRAGDENGGNMWQRRSSSRPGYEVPKTEDFSGPTPSTPWFVDGVACPHPAS